MSKSIQDIVSALNSTKSIDAGMALEGSVRVSDNVVNFSYPAPVVGEYVLGSVTVNPDGTIDDSLAGVQFRDVTAWRADFDECIADAGY